MLGFYVDEQINYEKFIQKCEDNGKAITKWK